MPCDDMTEVIELRLDQDDRLVDYSLRKRSCGAPAGEESLLLRCLRARLPSEIFALHAADALASVGDCRRSAEMLVHKHLHAVQSALRVYLGAERGARSDSCVVAKVSADADGVRFTGLVSVPLTGPVPPCNELSRGTSP